LSKIKKIGWNVSPFLFSVTKKPHALGFTSVLQILLDGFLVSSIEAFFGPSNQRLSLRQFGFHRWSLVPHLLTEKVVG